MPATRHRRIVRRAVMSLAAVVLLPVLYLGSVATLIMGSRAGVMPDALIETRLPSAYFKPMQWYLRAELPGSGAIKALMTKSSQAGRRLSR